MVKPRLSSRVWLSAMLMVALVGCSGEISGPGGSTNNNTGDMGGPDATTDAPIGPDGAPLSCETPEIGEQPLRRLSSEQYHNVVRDLLPPALHAEMLPLVTFPDTRIESGFANDADANTVSQDESNRIEDNAEQLAIWIDDNANVAIPQLMPCISTGFAPADIDGCIDAFIDDFGLRAYRRPMTAGERQIVRGLYDDLSQVQGQTSGFVAIMHFFLQSPGLLYRVERGNGMVDGATNLVRLNDYEMASRLSFFFLNSMPDQALFDAAQAGELQTHAQVEAQARRLLASPDAEATIGVFHRDWLRVYEIEDALRDAPEFTEAARAAMLTETQAFVSHVLNNSDGSLQTLLTTNEFPVDADLAAIYGMGGAGITTLANRHGILTQASVMAAHSYEGSTAPIERGAFFMREFMCGYIPPFPGDVDVSGPLVNTANLPTARERLSPLMERTDCAGCHISFNPLGFALETYDEVGQYRATENGAAIDPSGDIAIGDAMGTFDDVHGMLDIAAQSEQVHNCYSMQWFRFAHGRRESGADGCDLADVQTAFLESGGNIEELLVTITISDAFMYRRAIQE